MNKTSYEQLKKCNALIANGGADFTDENGWECSVYGGESSSATVGQWSIALGGYDTGYEVRRDGDLVAEIQYGDREYRWYGDDDIREEVLKILGAEKFTCIDE